MLDHQRTGLAKIRLKIMIRKILLFLLLSSSSTAFALGLGGIKVESALNQPLDARVSLIAADPVAVEDIRVKLADPEAFRRAGIDRSFLLSKLRFKAVFPEDSEPYIQVSTRETIREPFLDFLLEVRWPQGSLVREFTVLLDPPTYQPPQSDSVVQSRTPVVSVATVQPSAPSTYGPVKRAETLWVIAGKVQSGPGVSRNRTMVALLKSNPDAFHQGNINQLKSGVLLAVPSAEEMAAISEQEARATVRQQMEEWRNAQRNIVAPSPTVNTAAEQVAVGQQSAAPSEPVVAEPVEQPVAEADAALQAPAASDEPSRALTAEERQRLRVVETERSWQLGEKSDAEYPVQESDKLREAIRDSEQELVAVQEINKDIIELRAALESKVAALKKALDEKDAQLENLRRQISQVGEVRTAPGSVTNPASVAPAVAPPPGNVPVSAPVTELSPLSAGWKNEYWMILMGAVIIVLAALLLLTLRGRSRETVYETPELFETSTTDVGDIDEPSQSKSIPDQPVDVPITAVPAPRKENAHDISLLPEKSEDVASILMEADIYLAYRRYSQAESLVEEAMELNPDSLELKAKLLEIHAFRRDKTSFSNYLDQVAPVLMAQSPELWDRVVEMGRPLVPEHPAWQQQNESTDAVAHEPHPKPLSESEGTPEQDPFDLDIDLDDLEIPSSEDSGPVTFNELIQDDSGAEEDDIPTIDMDFDFDEPDEPSKDK